MSQNSVGKYVSVRVISWLSVLKNKPGNVSRTDHRIVTSRYSLNPQALQGTRSDRDPTLSWYITFLIVSLIQINDNNEKAKNIHPGEIVLEEFLKPLETSAYRLSKEISIPQTRSSEIIKGNRRITADTALRLSKFFGNSAKFWLGLQDDFNIEEEKNHKQKDINLIKQYVHKGA